MRPLRQVVLVFNGALLTSAACDGHPLLSLSTLVLDAYERQDDIIQHAHPRWLYFEPRLSFLGDVVCPMKFSNHSLLLIGGDQLATAIRCSVSTERSC